MCAVSVAFVWIVRASRAPAECFSCRDRWFDSRQPLLVSIHPFDCGCLSASVVGTSGLSSAPISGILSHSPTSRRARGASRQIRHAIFTSLQSKTLLPSGRNLLIDWNKKGALEGERDGRSPRRLVRDQARHRPRWKQEVELSQWPHARVGITACTGLNHDALDFEGSDCLRSALRYIGEPEGHARRLGLNGVHPSRSVGNRSTTEGSLFSGLPHPSLKSMIFSGRAQ